MYEPPFPEILDPSLHAIKTMESWADPEEGTGGLDPSPLENHK